MSTQQLRSVKPVNPLSPPINLAVAGVLQRKCACGRGLNAGGDCAKCRRKQHRLQRRANNATQLSAVPPIVHSVLRSGGQSLDPATRSFMEPRFGHDFGAIRVHTGSTAAQSARAVNALAYTVGRHIVFGTGRYAPDTRAGRELLAHELAHTIQQGQADVTATAVGLSDDASEREASQAADTVVSVTPRSASAAKRDQGILRRRNSGEREFAHMSASETAARDNVTADDARRALIAAIGEARYRLLEQRLMGGLVAGESEAASAGIRVSSGGMAPRVSRRTDVPELQALGPALPIAGALAAMALCAFGFYNYALDNFPPDRDDKWLHCWTSCKIAAWCGTGMTGPGIAGLLGLGKEVIDAICDALDGPCGAEWEDVFADAKGIGCGMVPLLPCDTCCDQVV